MSFMPSSVQVVLYTVSERDACDGLHALGWAYMYCYCNHIYSMVLQRGFVGAFSKSLLDSSGRINFSSFVDVLSHCLLGISSIEFSNHSLVASGPSTG